MQFSRSVTMLRHKRPQHRSELELFSPKLFSFFNFCSYRIVPDEEAAACRQTQSHASPRRFSAPFRSTHWPIEKANQQLPRLNTWHALACGSKHNYPGYLILHGLDIPRSTASSPGSGAWYVPHVLRNGFAQSLISGSEITRFSPQSSSIGSIHLSPHPLRITPARHDVF